MKFIVIILVLFGAVYLVSRYLRTHDHGERVFRSLFGADRWRTVGEVEFSGVPMGTGTVKVHLLQGEPGKDIGLEIMAGGIGFYSAAPIALSVENARQLVDCLEQATGDGRARSIPGLQR